jgi:hypothetical protein
MARAAPRTESVPVDHVEQPPSLEEGLAEIVEAVAGEPLPSRLTKAAAALQEALSRRLRLRNLH